MAGTKIETLIGAFQNKTQQTALSLTQFNCLSQPFIHPSIHPSKEKKTEQDETKNPEPQNPPHSTFPLTSTP
jgi:hypothetical protein